MTRMRTERMKGWSSLADVLHDLGDIAPERVCVRHPLGTATEKDLIRIQTKQKRRCELVDGVLVEKIMGYPQACVTSVLDRRVGTFVEAHDLGYTATPDGPSRLFRGLVRFPDLTFVS